MEARQHHKRKPSRDVPLSLRDIQAATPAEAKDETIVISGFEKTNPTGSLTRDQVHHPHFDIPLEVLEVSTNNDANDANNANNVNNNSSNNNTNNNTNNKGKGKDKRPGLVAAPSTVEADLLAYTQELNAIQEDHPDAAHEVQSMPTAGGLNGNQTNRGEAEKLADNLGKLFHRHHTTNTNDRPPDHRRPSHGDIEEGGKKVFRRVKRETADSWNEFNEFLSPRRRRFYGYAKNIVLVAVLPSALLAALFYYVLGNPTANLLSSSSGNGAFSQFLVEERSVNSTEATVESTADSQQDASISWWILFIGVRQFITLGLARLVQLFVIDYLCLHSRMVSRFLGPFVTLLLVQSRGWPCVLTSWGAIDFLMLFGSGRFARHWLFYQPWLEVANEENQAGTVLESDRYRAILICAIVLGVATSFKRFWVGLLFGKRSYTRYSDKLSDLLRRSLLVSKLARFAAEKDYDEVDYYKNEDKAKLVSSINSWLGTESNENQQEESAETNSLDDSTTERTGSENENSSNGRGELLAAAVQNKLTQSEHIKIVELLGEWEDMADDEKPNEDPSLSAIVMFRTSVNFLDSETPFSPPFGVVRTRIENLEGSQRLYNRLVDKQKQHGIDDEELQFASVALTAFDGYRRLDETKTKELIALFRPGRDGGMPLLEFCKSIDQLYKEIRMLRASIANEGKMNKASEQIINVFFFIFIGMILLAIVGVDPIALFGATSAFIVGSAFIIGGASSKYFEGLLLILVQRPYDIGDMISIYNKEGNLSVHGYQPWRVKDVGLYHTTIVHFTGEFATISNGALAQSRIVNGARSPKGLLLFFMKFGVKHATNERVEEYKERVASFMKGRPREWLGFLAFRITRIEPHLGFVEYIHVVQHRERWQEVGAMLDSVSDVQRHAHEVSKELGMDYESPPLPVQLGNNAQAQGDFASVQPDALGRIPAQSMMQNLNQALFHHG